MNESANAFVVWRGSTPDGVELGRATMPLATAITLVNKLNVDADYHEASTGKLIGCVRSGVIVDLDNSYDKVISASLENRLKTLMFSGAPPGWYYPHDGEPPGFESWRKALLLRKVGGDHVNRWYDFDSSELYDAYKAAVSAARLSQVDPVKLSIQELAGYATPLWDNA